MNISSRLDYAISCLAWVADAYEKDRSISATEIAKKERIETDYVEQLMTKLKGNRIIRSIRGVKGGYVLADTPDNILLVDIVRTFDRDVLALVCDREKGRRKECIHYAECTLKAVWQGLREAMQSYLKDCTLKMLLEKRKQENVFQEAREGIS